ncbi:hypothetical protein F5Y13DRAFT_197674 [Hypoxylon sp. FL1857]|nr:hypothetical protein F5Y13DRAFT_197674 [Hypoxylon sp. FL1857]
MDPPTLTERPLKLTRLLHSRSASNMLDIVGGTLSPARGECSSEYRVSSKKQSDVSMPSDISTWSIKALRKEWKAKTHTHSSSYLPGGALPGQTAGIHRHQEESMPPRHGRYSRFRSQSSSSTLADSSGGYGAWLEGTSSRKDCVSSRSLSRTDCSGGVPTETQTSIEQYNSLAKITPPRNTPEMAARYIGEVVSVESTSRGEQSTASCALAKYETSARKNLVESKSSNIHQYPDIPGSQRQNPEKPILSNLREEFRGSRRRLTVNTETPTRLNLTAPKDPLLPESPGFPSMLAAFPSPPTASRPLSQDKSINPVAPRQGVAITPPTVRPRTSSRPLCISNGAPPLSGNLILQPTTPILRHAKLSDAPPSSVPDKWIANKLKLQPSPSLTSLVETSCDLIIHATNSLASQRRQSSEGYITADTSSSQRSLITNEPGGFFTTSTPLSTRACATDGVKVPTHHEESHRCFTYPVSSLAQSQHREDLVSSSLTAQSCKQISSNKAATDSPGLGADERRSIIERRAARRAKVQAYKRRDLDAAKFAPKTAAVEAGSKDSPVLGSFTDSFPHPRKLSLQEPSQAWMNQVSTQNTSPTHKHCSPPSRGSITLTPAQLMLKTTTEEAKATPVACTPSYCWSFSPIMVAEVTPDQCSSVSISPLVAHEIAISPIIVVADLKPQPGSATLFIPSISPCTTTHSPLRHALKHKLRIIPQPRPKSASILMHRNPVTGEVERTTPGNGKFNRHSLTSMPTIPPSPSALSLRRRSHPTGTFSWAQSPRAKNLSEQLEQSVKNATNEQQCDENQLRAASVRERVQREKRAKEEEISELVEKVISAPKDSKSENKDERQESQGEGISQQIENRLRRLEEDGDAWLRVVKTLLGNMSKKLEDLKEDSNNKGLTMSEFNINMDDEARRLSLYNHTAPMIASLTTVVQNTKFM